MAWIIKNDLLSLQLNDSNYYIPNAETILKISNEGTFSYNDQTYEADFGIRISKIGLTCSLELNLIEDKIHLQMFTTKQGTTLEVPFINTFFADSIVINNVWHFLSGDYLRIKELLKDLKSNILNYQQYAEIIKLSQINNIIIRDNVLEKLRNNAQFNNNRLPILLNAKLFEYQKIGCNWLSFMKENGCSAILADEMGLGKTLQVISMFGYIKEKSDVDVHFLVVAPLSLLENWKREIDKFYPNLTILINHGKEQTYIAENLLKYDVVITTYDNIKHNFSILYQKIEWDIVALDEAQHIKSPTSQTSKYIKMLNRKSSLAITGTPFENHMTDIWSLMDFILPGFLGDLNSFNETFVDDNNSAYKLETIISPVMIRRRVKDVAKDLPERIDIPHPVTMTDAEADLYEGERKTLNGKTDLKTFSLFDMQKLRMFCTHPKVYNHELESEDPAVLSNKYNLLCSIIKEIILNNEKVIIFTSFTEMKNILVNDLSKRFNCYTDFINGEIPGTKRQEIVDRFSEINGAAILILNPQTGGTGLNITAANHVIHYNLEWNPAVEDQASARAYRRGQEKTVFIHRLFYTNTIEEVMNERIMRKRELSDIAVIGNVGQINKEDLIKVLNMSPYKEIENNGRID